MMNAFWIFFGIDAVIALVTLFFFAQGMGDGSVSSYNIGIWLVLVVGIAIPTIGGWLVRQRGNLTAATIILAVLAIPGGLIGLFFLLLIGLPGGYN